MNKNITLDFTANKAMESVTNNQPLAIMPAELAKKLLKDYAKKLYHTTEGEIIQLVINDLIALKGDHTNHNKVQTAIEYSANFIQERSLIENCAQENWDAFAVPQEEEVRLM